MIECAYENKNRGRFNLLTASETGVGVEWRKMRKNEVPFFFLVFIKEFFTFTYKIVITKKGKKDDTHTHTNEHKYMSKHSENRVEHLQKQKRKKYISTKYWKTQNLKEQQDK